MKLSINKIQNFIMISLLFLAAMNFGAKFFYFIFAAFFVLMLFRRRLVVTPAAAVYLLLSVLMAFYNAPEGVLSMLRCMAWVMCFLVGLNITAASREGLRLRYDRNKSEMSAGVVLFTIAAGSFGHFLLNFLYNRQNAMGRNTNDIWSGAIMAATGQAALCCIMCGLAVAMVFAPTKKGHRLAGLACLGVMLVYNLVLACRTPLVILAVLLVIGVVYSLKQADTKEKMLRLLSQFLLVAAVIAVIVALDLFGIRQWLAQSNLFERFMKNDYSVGETDRYSNKLLFLQNSLNYPWGGSHMMEQFGYAHDLWLDGYDEYGVFGLILLVFITVDGIGCLTRVLRRTQYSRRFKLMLLCVYVAVLLEFCVEPILQGMGWLFACYCLINGCIHGLELTHRKTLGECYENPAD